MTKENYLYCEVVDMETIIVTDSCCDLPYDYIQDNAIEMIPMTITVNQTEHKDDLAKTKDYEQFYKSILEGAMPKTSQINAYEFKEVFMKYLKEEKNILYIGFSSALSGCVESARMAAREIREENPDFKARVEVIDSKCASMGQGLVVYYAVEQLKQGKSMNEVLEYIENIKLKINHWFTVTDLNYLFRGGRVSKTAATVGTLLQIKPIMHVDDDGRLMPVEKVKGRKKSLKVLVEKVKENIVNPEKQVVFISHGAALEEAEGVKKAIIEQCGVKDVWINYVGATVGSHSGPGTIAIFFMGEHR